MRLNSIIGIQAIALFPIRLCGLLQIQSRRYLLCPTSMYAWYAELHRSLSENLTCSTASQSVTLIVVLEIDSMPAVCVLAMLFFSRTSQSTIAKVRTEEIHQPGRVKRQK